MCAGSMNETYAKYCEKIHNGKNARKVLEIVMHLKTYKG